MTFDLEKIAASKERYRRKLAALPIGEKLRMLDRLRERELSLRAARASADAGVQTERDPEARPARESETAEDD
jgi:hypothetical protein